MVSRSARKTVLALAVGVAAVSVACQKVPLLAPSGSTITLTAAASALPINGSTDIIAQVIEASGTPPHEGTRITFTTSLGSIQPSEADTDVGGRAIVKFVAGTTSGVAAITALSGGTAISAANAVRIQIGAAAVGGVSVQASPGTLSAAGGTSTVTATVFDASGNTLAGVPVTFAIDTANNASGAGSLSATVVSTDASGRASTQVTTNRTTVVVATAGVATSGGGTTTGGTTTPTTSPQTARVTINVNTTTSISIGTPVPATPLAGQAVTIPLTFGGAATGGTTSTASPIVRGTVDWGDGAVAPFTGQPASLSHVYRSAGSFLIVVTGIDSSGDVATASTALTVGQQPRPAVTIAASGSPTVGSVVSFTVTATEGTGSTATITSVTIDYGDGTSDTLQGSVSSVQHIYRAAGTYRVTAVATDSNGQSGSGSTVIVVS